MKPRTPALKGVSENVSGEYPPRGFVLLDCGHVVRKSHPVIPVGEAMVCSELCASRIEKQPPRNAEDLLRAIASNPTRGENP